MERNEGIVRWSPNQTRDEFTVFNLNTRSVQLYAATGHAQPGKFDHQPISKHTEIPQFITYDWSPTIHGLVAAGTQQGEVHLLRVDDNSNASITLPLKLQRACQSVAFNTTGLLAVGLDRIRNDSCLQIWDVNQRLGDWDPKKPGWSVPTVASLDPKKKLEGSVSITSVRFFEDNPQTLVVGVKNQSVRLHDLRDPNSSVITFQTRCCNNLAIDFADTNYFASSSLDQPALYVWDRRAASRSIASPLYLEAIDQDDVPWGGALKLNSAILTEPGMNIHIKQIRYSREHRGTLGVLSSAGQLQIYRTRKEFVEPGSADDVGGSPELLEVKKSHDLEYPCFDPDHKRDPKERIVSFDWMNLGTQDLEPRVVVLRANGNLEVLQMPSATSNQLSQLIPWAPPRHRHNHAGLMKFADPKERESMLAPLYATAAKANVPVFGPQGFNSDDTQKKLAVAVKQAIHSDEDPVVNLLALQEMGKGLQDSDSLGNDMSNLNLKGKGKEDAAESGEASNKLPKFQSSRELHDMAHYSVQKPPPTLHRTSETLESEMLRRAKAGYLFDCMRNKEIVESDPWLQDVWEYISSADKNAKQDGMVAGNIDLSYLGVYPIWANSLGEKSKSRIIDGSVIPDAAQFERLIGVLLKKYNLPEWKGIATGKPHHRTLCLATLSLNKEPKDLDNELKFLAKEGQHTQAAAYALFEGLSYRAIAILKSGGRDLLFVAMALEMKVKTSAALELNASEWSQALEENPEMAGDSYLRAIYGYITSADWTAIANETTLPLRERVGVALRYFDDDKLTAWLEQQMNEAINHGDIEGIMLAGVTDNMIDVLAKYVEKFGDYQTPILIMSYCYPRYIDDIRAEAWRANYKAFLQRHKEFILRVKFEQMTTRMSRERDGKPVIKPPPRQVTIRCLNCDGKIANDQANSGASTSAAGPSQPTADVRNPLIAAGVNAGIACPRCGSHLPRCPICMEFVGVPRSDRPEQSTDPVVRRMANFPMFCMKCKHVSHMDHATAWFKRHKECPVPECKCQCNDQQERRWGTGYQ
ncbi:hypothetical protein B0J14DRAFT_577770 [Halenospora varia]|nr:hypothetical protein B0J14DRAFT_577770 [Halenospora varia]